MLPGQHFLVQCRHRHLPDDVVRRRLVAGVDDPAASFERQDGSRRRCAVLFGPKFCRSDGDSIQYQESRVDLRYVVAGRPDGDMRRVIDEARLEGTIVVEQVRQQCHKTPPAPVWIDVAARPSSRPAPPMPTAGSIV